MSASNMFPWDFDTAVKRVQSALNDLGGIEGLHKDEIPVHYVMASNWIYARELEAKGAIPVSCKMRARYAKRAKREPEVWDAMVLIIGTSMNGHYDEAYRIVNRTIGERPGNRSGPNPRTNMQRNAFIVDWFEILEDVCSKGIEKKERIKVGVVYKILAKVLQENPETIRQGRKAYQRKMEELNPEPEDDPLRDEWNRVIDEWIR